MNCSREFYDNLEESWASNADVHEGILLLMEESNGKG